MAAAEPRIDHVLVNVNDRLDEAAALYRRLGFNLMPRGHHSVGSSNHLAIFEDDYFELLGYEPHNAERAAGLWGDVAGFAGMILKTDDAPSLAATLRARSIAMVTEEPKALSRMVDLPDGTSREARFSSIHLDPAITPGGMVLFCQHLTPELVWREEWQSHPNGVRAISGISIACIDPATSIGLFERIYGSASVSPIEGGGWQLAARNAAIDYLTRGMATKRFGSDLAVSQAETDRNVAIEFRTSSLQAVRSTLDAAGFAYGRTETGKILVPASSACGAALVFCES